MSYHSTGFGCFLLSGMCCVDVAPALGMVVGTANCLSGVEMPLNRLIE